MRESGHGSEYGKFSALINVCKKAKTREIITNNAVCP